MSFKDLFASFSNRPRGNADPPRPLTASFRHRVLMRCRDVVVPHSYNDFWAEIQSKLSYLHGTPQLARNRQARNVTEDVLIFLEECKDEHFLDFIEFIFKAEAYFHVPTDVNLVGEFNEFFDHDNLPYAVTDFVWVDAREMFMGSIHDVRKIAQHPRVIRKDSQVTHDSAIRPALELLHSPAFAAANAEFLEALEDYRKSDYGDCLTKCGSAFESVLKVICTRRRWPFDATDTASPLLQTVIREAGLEPFLEQPLILVATLRNRLSTAHGAGTAARAVTQAKAQYGINATAAAILLLVAETS
jgi:hypothetical protein